MESPKTTKKTGDTHRSMRIFASDEERTPTNIKTEKGSELFTRWTASNEENNQATTHSDDEEGTDIVSRSFEESDSRNDVINKVRTAMDVTEGFSGM